jgi:hypothetical protein
MLKIQKLQENLERKQQTLERNQKRLYEIVSKYE